MEQNLDNKSRLIFFYEKNKIKFYSFIILLLILIFSIFLFILNNEKKNNLIAEKYIQAGIYLNKKQIDQSIILYEEIILSKNKIYSILAINNILENNLISDQNKVLKLLRAVESLDHSSEYKDLLILKKALYLIKIKNLNEGNALLKNLINKDSKIKYLAEEILKK